MGDDLVKRLRRRWDWSNDENTINDMIDERSEAADRIEALEAKVQSLTTLLDNQLGTPCEQVRHQEQVEALEAKLEKAVEALEWAELYLDEVNVTSCTVSNTIAELKGATND